MILLFSPLLLRVETNSDWSVTVTVLILNNLTPIHKIGSPKAYKAFGEMSKQCKEIFLLSLGYHGNSYFYD